MAKPESPSEPLIETYYYPVISKNSLEKCLFYNLSDKIPVSIIGLLSNGSHLSGTEYFINGDPAHPDIIKFISISGTNINPGETFDYTYFQNISYSSISLCSTEFYKLSPLVSSFLNSSAPVIKQNISYVKSEDDETYRVIDKNQKQSVIDSEIDYLNLLKNEPAYFAVYKPKTTVDGSNLSLFSLYTKFPDRLSFLFNLNYLVIISNFYGTVYVKPFVNPVNIDGTEYLPTEKHFRDIPFFDFIGQKGFNGEPIQLPQDEKFLGILLAGRQYLNVVQDQEDFRLDLDGNHPHESSVRIFKCNAKVVGQVDFTNTTFVERHHISFSGKKLTSNVSGNNHLPDSEQVIELPEVTLSGSGSNLGREVLKLMTKFSLALNVNPTMPLGNFLNDELKINSSLAGSIISDVLDNCKVLDGG